MNRHNRSRRFAQRSIVWFAVAVIMTAGAVFTWWTAHITDGDMRADILRKTRLLADAIHLKGLASLSGTEADLTASHYLRLKDQLADAHNVFPNCRFLYLMGQKPDGALFFFADSEAKGSEDESPAGQLYEEASEVTLRVFLTGRAETDGPTADRWGTWVSALVPLADPRTGKIMAVVGMDVDARDWQGAVMRKMILPVVFTMMLVIIVLAASALLKWRRLLPAERQNELLPSHIETLITAAAGLAITLIVAYKAYDVQDNARRETFSRLAMAKAAGITETMRDIRSNQLEGLSRFFESSVHVERKEFETYAGYLTEDPAVQSWQWIPAISAKEISRREEEALRSGTEKFIIWERNAEGKRTAVTARTTYYPVSYVEPLMGNESTLGYDMGSEAKRRAAIETAARTGLTTATDPIALSEEKGTKKGILVFRPIFDQHKRLQGFASCLLHIESMLMHAVRQPGDEEAAVVLELYQIQSGGRDQLLASTSSELASSEGVESGLWHYPDEAFTVVAPLFAYGKTYAVVAHPGPAFADIYPVRAGLFSAMAGFALTSVIVLLIGFLGNRRLALEQQVLQRTAELKESEHHFRTLADSGHALIWTSGPDKKCDYFNKPWLAFTGRTLEQEIGDGWVEGVHPEDLSRCIETYTDAFDGRECFSMIYRLRRHDDEYRWIQDNGCPRYDTHGNYLGYIGHCLDITELKQAAEELKKHRERLEELVENRTAELGATVEQLNKEIEQRKLNEKLMRESEERYRTLVETSPDAIVLIDSNMSILMANQSSLKIFGYDDISEVIGRSALNFLASENWQQALRDVKDMLVTEITQTLEYSLIKKNGESFPSEIRASLVKNAGGNQESIILMIRDISGRKEAEKKIEALNEALKRTVVKQEAANKELESFSYSVSHDLRTPLRAIHGFSKILQDDFADKLADEGKRYLQIICDSTNKMGELIDDLLAFSRIGKTGIRLSKIEMEPLVQSTIEELNPLLNGKKVQFHIGNLPTVQGDQAMIRQVIVNLLTNALKFTGLREVAIIEVSGYSEGHENIYYVRDNGVGFDMQYVHKLFAVFQRLHSDDEFEGTGIGLALVKRIISKHGGRVWAEGKVNEGATFFFTLPRE